VTSFSKALYPSSPKKASIRSTLSFISSFMVLHTFKRCGRVPGIPALRYTVIFLF
jgi:hypothetical protein